MDELEGLHATRRGAAGDEAERKLPPGAGVDSVRTPAAARLLEQAAHLTGTVAVAAPVRPV